MSAITAVVQITSFHPGAYGGGAALGHEQRGDAKGPLIRTLVPARVLPRGPVKGEFWRFSGEIEARSVFDPKLGRDVMIDHLIADWAGPMTPTGEGLRNWIAHHPGIAGVGKAYAARLWDRFGIELYRLLRGRDVAALAEVLDFPKAALIVDAFTSLIDEVAAFEDLDGLGLDGGTICAAVTLFGNQAGARFRQNPYLMTLLEPWEKVDRAARLIGVSATDERRLTAAVDLAASRAWTVGKHTAIESSKLIQRVRPLLGRTAEHLANEAVANAVSKGDLKRLDGGLLQGRAPWHIESAIRASVIERLDRPRHLTNPVIINVVIAEIEREDGIQFEPEQRAAVHTALTSGVTSITGGAGTGKSTVAKAIMRAAHRLSHASAMQIAMSGRAAKRLKDATGEPAMTVYRYLKALEFGQLRMTSGILIIDEFSMVSTPDFWTILTHTPASVDIILIGDPGQLPPIQAGNPIAAVAASSRIPQVTLVANHRQARSTGVPAVARNVRDGQVPSLPYFEPNEPDRPGVFIRPSHRDDVLSGTLEVFAAFAGNPAKKPSGNAMRRLHGADIQILTMTKAMSDTLGDAIESRWLEAQPSVYDWGYHAGSKLLWVKNAYGHPGGLSGEPTVDIMNGELGIIQDQTALGATVLFDDGLRVELQKGDLNRILRGWAITVHKAQGSAFKRVIIPVTPSRMLDRALLYTAITRAKVTAVLVGDPELISRAVLAEPHAWRRNQGLNFED